MARAIGQPFDRRVAAETEILRARGADRPAASLVVQLEQRATVSVVDRLVIGIRPRLAAQFQSERSRAVSLRGIRSRNASCIAAFFARQIEAGEFADDGVAAHPDVVGNFAAGQPGFKAAFRKDGTYLAVGPKSVMALVAWEKVKEAAAAKSGLPEFAKSFLQRSLSFREMNAPSVQDAKLLWTSGEDEPITGVGEPAA